MTNTEAIKIINQYDCNFYWTDGERILTEDLIEAFELAVKALDAQTPRVLTFEEIDGLANKREETVVYLERRWDTSIYGAIAGNCNGVLPSLSSIGTMRNVVQQYNKTWRCWSAKPTDEQREWTPWQG